MSNEQNQKKTVKKYITKNQIIRSLEFENERLRNELKREDLKKMKNKLKLQNEELIQKNKKLEKEIEDKNIIINFQDEEIQLTKKKISELENILFKKSREGIDIEIKKLRNELAQVKLENTRISRKFDDKCNEFQKYRFDIKYDEQKEELEYKINDLNIDIDDLKQENQRLNRQCILLKEKVLPADIDFYANKYVSKNMFHLHKKYGFNSEENKWFFPILKLESQKINEHLLSQLKQCLGERQREEVRKTLATYFVSTKISEKNRTPLTEIKNIINFFLLFKQNLPLNTSDKDHSLLMEEVQKQYKVLKIHNQLYVYDIKFKDEYSIDDTPTKIENC